MAVKFYKQSIKFGDYISFILPISQLNNNQQMYEFGLVYSEDLGKQQYSGRKVHCCLNIYKKPECGFNGRPNYHLQDVEIKESRIGQKIINKEDFNYDIRICGWGVIGKQVDYPNQYAKEFCIKINNIKLQTKIIKLLKDVDWVKEYPMTTTPNLTQWQIYKYIKDNIPEIK